MAEENDIAAEALAASKIVNKVTIQSKSENPAKGQTDLPSEIDQLRPQIGTFRYPIANKDEMLKQIIPGHKYYFRGKAVNVEKSIPKIPASFFPIKTADDFEAKIKPKIKARPVLPILRIPPILKHPTSENVPKAAQKKT